MRNYGQWLDRVNLFSTKVENVVLTKQRYLKYPPFIDDIYYTCDYKKILIASQLQNRKRLCSTNIDSYKLINVRVCL